MASGSKVTQRAKDYPDNSKSSDSIKHMLEMFAWFDEHLMRLDGESGADYWKRSRKRG